MACCIASSVLAIFGKPSRLRVEVPRLERLPVLRRGDSGCVRRRVLSSVRGRRGGRQRDARSRTIPEYRSVGRARPQRGGTANKGFHAHHREPRPGEGTPVIATFRRGSFLLFLLTAGGVWSRLCRPERHRRLAREAELGAVPPHPVKHHADPPGQRNGRALPAAPLLSLRCEGTLPGDRRCAARRTSKTDPRHLADAGLGCLEPIPEPTLNEALEALPG